jgi:hypothetical protein
MMETNFGINLKVGFKPKSYESVRSATNNLDYVVITWPSTGTPGGVMIVAKSLRSMVPARGFEPLAP